ncbi:DUF2484 family protein [Yoonia sp. 2307UL14-13]|uniref:DUF2484 family protein n=1 Tax=Yoonia sp. 2307UL14-13 TaxID=3126506 RepID=UPI0030AE240C
MQLVPSNDHHWRRAYVLMAVGVPLLVWVTWRDGPLIGFIGLAVGAAVLRWPVYYLYLWLMRQMGGHARD